VTNDKRNSSIIFRFRDFDYDVEGKDSCTFAPAVVIIDQNGVRELFIIDNEIMSKENWNKDRRVIKAKMKRIKSFMKK
jgi:hypothetical protein